MAHVKEAPQRFTDVEALIDYVRGLGATTSDETPKMTELDHGLQCAYELSLAVPEDIELQVAGLLHDIAHRMDHEPGGPLHGIIGGQAVIDLMGPRVAELVEGHVPAKRWLVTRDESYRSLLSPISIMTLEAQGGTMTDEEADAFEATTYWQDSLVLRRADDNAKTPGRQVPTLDHWIPAITALASGVSAPAPAQ